MTLVNALCGCSRNLASASVGALFIAMPPLVCRQWPYQR
jgi:hypothetical protein